MVHRLAESHRFEQDFGLVVGRVVQDLLHAHGFDALGHAGQQQRQHVVREPRVDAGGEERGLAFGARFLEGRGEVGERACGMNERNERARYDVLSRREDRGHVLHRLDGTQVAGRRVAHRVGVHREQRVGVVRCEHAGRLVEAAQVRGVAPRFRVGRHPQPDELHVGMADDPAQRVAADVSGAPLDDSVRHGVPLRACEAKVYQGRLGISHRRHTGDTALKSPLATVSAVEGRLR